MGEWTIKIQGRIRMKKFNIKKDGISLRMLYFWLILIAVIISILMIFSTYHLSSFFLRLSKATDEHLELEKAAYELMDASDYLTEKVQCFTINGELQYMEDYFTEAFETNRREDAISKMSGNSRYQKAEEALKGALDTSRDLMAQEYYAMRLVVESRDYKTYPEQLRGVSLSDEDLLLSPDEKLRHATELVHNKDYYGYKDAIRLKIKKCLEELDNLTRIAEEKSTRSLHRELFVVRVIIVVQTIGIILMVWLSSSLGINPVLKAVERIKDDSPIPEVGANEFRYLARTYNKMYMVYKNSVEHLNYKASHDELTGVYNRAGYDLLLTSIDLNTTYMLIIDLDDFKQINDTYGHEMGDRILIKAANALKNKFRSDDYVCRIGGDEFVVLMVHSNESQQKLIAEKIDQINNELKDTSDGLPIISISVGIAHGTQATDTVSLFERTDECLYRAKRNGKHGYMFYRQ